MLLTFLLMAATPPGCTEVKQQCRACTTRDGKPQCSTIGIACQPVVRVCRLVRPRGQVGTPRVAGRDGR